MTDEIRKAVLEALLNEKSPVNIMEGHIPQKIYKYRYANNRDLDALEKDTIWIANATRMDDPNDSKDLRTDGLKQQIHYLVNNVDRFKDDKYRIHEKEDSLQKECFICSFSETCNSKDMWERYANSEHGICIEYDTLSLMEAINPLLLLPVYYDKKEPDDAETLSKICNAAMVYRNFLVKDRMGMNGEDWYSQREWRIIAFRKSLGLREDEEGKCLPIIKPTGIILGKYISEDKKNRILTWAQREENRQVCIVNEGEVF